MCICITFAFVNVFVFVFVIGAAPMTLPSGVSEVEVMQRDLSVEPVPKPPPLPSGFHQSVISVLSIVQEVECG